MVVLFLVLLAHYEMFQSLFSWLLHRYRKRFSITNFCPDDNLKHSAKTSAKVTGFSPLCPLFRDYLVAEARDKKQMEYDISNWTNHNPKVCPHCTTGLL